MIDWGRVGLGLFYLGWFIICCWLTFFTWQALGVLSRFEMNKYFYVFPPKQTTFYAWVARAFGIIGMFAFGFGVFAMIVEKP